jgi:transcriptional regulator with XRE-family HTH domain
MIDLSRQIAARLKFLRESYGWTAEQTEEKLGLSRGTWSRIESGKRGRMFTVDILVACAKGFRARDLNWLVLGKVVHPELLPEVVTGLKQKASASDDADWAQVRMSAPRARRLRKPQPRGAKKTPPKAVKKRGV